MNNITPMSDTATQEKSATIEATETTVPDNTPGSESTPTQQQTSPDLQSRIDGASSIEDVEKLLTEARKPAPEPKLAAEQAEETDPEAVTEPEEPETEEDPDPETDTEEPEELEPDEPDEEEPDPQEESAHVEKPDRVKVRPRLQVNDVEKLALELKHRNPDMSLSECEARAKKQLNIKDDADNPNDEPAPKPPTVQELADKLASLKQQRRKALSDDLDLNKAAEIFDEIESTMDAIAEAKAKELQQEQLNRSLQQFQFDQTWESSVQKAVDLYQFTTDPKSEGAKRMKEIDQELKSLGDPLFDDPEKPLILAQMVARELRIAPRSRKATTEPPTHSAARPTSPARKSAPAPVASGASRTRTPTQKGTLAQRIDEIESINDLNKLHEQLGMPV